VKKELDPRTFSVSDSWAASLRIFSLVFTTWSMDHRRREERLRDPKLLDVGWVELVTPQLTLKPGTATHLIPAENTMLSNPNADVSIFTRSADVLMYNELRRLSNTGPQRNFRFPSFVNVCEIYLKIQGTDHTFYL
jgi:hypothetical protein